MLSNRQLFLDYLAKTSPDPLMLEITSGKGLYLYGPAGEKYTDIISGVSVSVLGHSHPEIIEQVKKQVDQHMHVMVYGELVQSPQVNYARALCNALGKGFESVYFISSGTEAIEGAIKLARKYTNRTEIISFGNAYHGSTLGALSIMGGSKYKQGYYPLIPGTRQLKFNYISDLKNITTHTACVIVEPIQAEAGVILPENGFLQKLRRRCDDTGTLLVFDEIQTGFGRTGGLFAFQKFNVQPDIIVLAKALGGGMPLGAFISSVNIMKELSTTPPLGHITTFGGHPVSCAAGMATLEIILRDSLHTQADQKGQLFIDNLKHPSIKEIRGTGLLLAVDLGSEELMHRTVKAAIRNGLITDWFLFNEQSIRISPPLNISEDEILEACKLIVSSIDSAI